MNSKNVLWKMEKKKNQISKNVDICDVDEAKDVMHQS
jgi:hypothetical protein